MAVGGRFVALALALCAGLAGGAASPSLTPTRYQLDVAIDPAQETLDAKATISLQAVGPAAAGVVSLLLYRLLPVKSVRLAGGEPLTFRQEVVSFEDFAPLQVNHVTVALKEPLAPGGSVTIEIAYGGYLLGYAETGMRYIQDRIDPEFTLIRADAYAYPIVGAPSLAALRSAAPANFSYRARITAPEGLTVASGGQLVRRTTHDGAATTVIESVVPSGRMDFAIGRYALLEEGPVRVFSLAGDEEGGARVVGAARAGLRLLSSWLGPLSAARRLTFLEIPDGWGSQADAGTIIQAAAAFRDSARIHEVYHELSHLWDPPPLDRPSPRWNEGLASFVEYLLDERLSGSPRIDARAEALLARLKENELEHPELGRVPMARYGAEGMTDFSYPVGGLLFHLLHRRMGEERFFRALRAFVAGHASKGGTTEDLANALRAEGGAEVAALLQEWLFTPRWVARVKRAANVPELLEKKEKK